MTPKHEKSRPRSSVTQLPGGKWHWYLTVGQDANGKPIRKSGTSNTKRQALTHLRDTRRAHRPAPAQTFTVAGWLDYWLQLKQTTLAAKTCSNYSKVIQRHILPALGQQPLDTLTSADLAHLFQTLSDKGFTDTQRQAHNILNAALEQAVSQQLLTENPAATSKPAAQPKPEAARPLTEAERAALLPILQENRWGVLFEFILYTGLKRAEVCALRWEHVNLNSGTLKLQANLSVVEGRAQASQPNRARHNRKLKLNEEALACLYTQLGVQDSERQLYAPGRMKGHPKHQKRQRPWEETGYVFTALCGRRLHPDSLKRHLHGFCDEAGIRHVSINDLGLTHQETAS